MKSFLSTILRWLEGTPFSRGAPWNAKSEFIIVNWSLNFLWLVRLLSISGWFLSFFKVRGKDGRLHLAAMPTELYIVGLQVLILSALVFAPLPILRSKYTCALAVILILDVCQYHAYLMIFRPTVDPNYLQYNFARTLVLTLLQYVGLIPLFGIIYLSAFHDQFTTVLGRTASWSLSAGILTGTGFSGITPNAGSTASIVGGIESIIGILFLTTIIGLNLTRATMKVVGDSKGTSQTQPSPDDPHLSRSP